MISPKIAVLSLALCVSWLAFTSVGAQEGSEDPLPEGEAAQPTEPTQPPSSDASRPFAARLEIDSHMPVSYGDDVIISVWITPREGIDLKYVRIHPQGDLTSIYVDSEKVGVDPAAQPAGPAEYIQGTSCRTEILNRQPGIPFVATCKLYSRKTGWRKWLDWNALIGAGRQQIEVEIALQDGQSGTASYYEPGGIDFVSPKSAVILGGFVGALLWSIFLWVSEPLLAAQATPIRKWRELFLRARDGLPGRVGSFLDQIGTSSRSCLLGGLTAMVLIILAKSTEGSEPSISIRIQDFWGGLLVGLASPYLSKKIREQVSKIGQ